MTPDEQHTVKFIMSFFNPAELIVNRSLALGVYPYIKSAECHLYLVKQMWEEANHCVAFEYALETFPFDRETIYEEHIITPSMHSKEEFVSVYMRRMTEDTLNIESAEGKKDFIRNLVATNIVMEGIWFYSGFMVMLSFRQRNRLKNFGSMVNWVLRDESLHLKFGMNLLLTILDENQELLTEDFAQISAGCTLSKTTYDRFMYNFNRGQYGKPSLSDRQAPFTAQVGMWWLYFRWQWLRDPFGNHPGFQQALATLFLLLAGLGGYVHWKRDRRSFTYFGPLVFMVTLALIYYMNFKYGSSQAQDLGETVPREVRDRDYFYLWSFSALSVWVALGLVFVWETLAALVGSEKVRVGNETLDLPHRRSWFIATPVLVLAIIPLFANWHAASRAGQTDTVDFASDLLNSVEPYGVLVTAGDNDTFPLWYAQEVEGIRRDVIVACLSLLNTDWYTRQILRRPLYDYDSVRGPAIYRGKVWKKPSGPPLRLTMQEADAVPPAIELSAPQTFRKDGTDIVVNIQPRSFGDFAGLERADLFVLYMIRDGFPDRPFFFSRTAGGYPEEMGFAPYTVTTGLARKLMPHVAKPGNGIVSVPEEGLLDVETTRALWETVFKAPKSLARRDLWVDRPSVSIPFLYMRTGLGLGTVLAQAGRTDEATRIRSQVARIARGTQLDDVLASITR